MLNIHKHETKEVLTFFIGHSIIIRKPIKHFFGDDWYLQSLEVQADEDELEIIENQFINIRSTKNRVVRWMGEDAIFIINNLKL